jgi:predicted transcriptional regulator
MGAAALQADALWAAVGDPTRRRLLDTLLAMGEATATTLAGKLPVTRQAVAKHLAVLDRVGRGGRRRRRPEGR